MPAARRFFLNNAITVAKCRPLHKKTATKKHNNKKTKKSTIHRTTAYYYYNKINKAYNHYFTT